MSRPTILERKLSERKLGDIMTIKTLTQSIETMLGNKHINIVDKQRRGEDTEFLLKLDDDIDYPTYCRIIITNE